VLPESVERKVDEVAGDHESGATHIAIRALRAFDLLVASGDADVSSVRELRERLEAAQPAMAAVRNAARLAADRLAYGTSQWPPFRDGLLRELEEGRRRVATNFLTVVPPDATVITLSRSVNVFECCVLAAQRGRLARVFVLESAPGLEGLRLAEDLREASVDAEPIPDGGAASRLGASAMSLVGADSVFADGSLVNKVGTRRLAEATRAAVRPMYVACESLKIDLRGSGPRWVAGPSPGPFDLTPPTLITGIVTDRGIVRPDQIATTRPR